MEKEVILQNATRNQLIKELFSRESITSVQVNSDEGATIITKFGKISVSGESNIFVIEPNFIDPLRSSFEKLNIGGNTVEFNAKENTTTEDSDVESKTVKSIVVTIDARKMCELLKTSLNEIANEIEKTDLFNTKENSIDGEISKDKNSLQLKLLEISATLIKLFNENKKEGTTTDNSDASELNDLLGISAMLNVIANKLFRSYR